MIAGSENSGNFDRTRADMDHRQKQKNIMRQPMHSNFIKQLSFVLAISLASGVQAADWTYDFDSPAPASWTVVSNTFPAGGSSATLVDAIESGYLRLSDATLAQDGGSFSAFAGPVDDVFHNVTVAVDLNVAKDTDDDLGVVARTNAATGDGYFASVDFELESACITKVQGFDNGVDLACSPLGSLDSGAAYHVEFSVTGSTTPSLELLVFDETGSSLVQSVLASDDGSSLGAPYQSGVSGIFMVPRGATLELASSNALNGTFDNAISFAVPEPSTNAMMLTFAAAGLYGFRRRQR